MTSQWPAIHRLRSLPALSEQEDGTVRLPAAKKSLTQQSSSGHPSRWFTERCCRSVGGDRLSPVTVTCRLALAVRIQGLHTPADASPPE